MSIIVSFTTLNTQAIYFFLCQLLITGKQILIKELVKNEPLTVTQILKLSPHSSNYIIPHRQENCKRYGLILYSTLHRPGAEEEAANLEQSLQTAGCDVSKLEWYDAGELHNMIESVLTSMIADCSLLIVCLMAHGSRGAIKGGSGKGIPVNDVLHQLSFALPKDLPLVRD